MQNNMPGIPVITMTRIPGRISPAAAEVVKSNEVDADVDADANKRPKDPKNAKQNQERKAKQNQ
jgi:hypothetical protein